ncbi:MAG: maltose ABC transporter permease [Candidatus Thermofonsia Clade 1 bacterium]|uniref:Maltose ABC transporter permease n=1 Tax=Candidatus Thermofonsia Clade 1 bacterium TaxID=2364210 RepID=A0A2M8NZY3_9CHLR|nr:MAG: maltose ABC transporter permease [Candidatus Thermofonsia Clade 1 bacterium]
MSSISQPILQTPRVAEGGLTFKQRRQLQNLVRYAILTVLIVFALFPVLWIVSASLNPLQSMASQRLIPNVSDPALLLKNYTDLLGNPDRYPFFRWLLNSTLVASVTAIGIVSITAPAAYAFSRFNFKGRRNLLLFMLLVQVFPNLLAMVSIFLMLQQLGVYLPFIGFNTHGGLVLVYIGGAMGTNIWLMKGFFDSIPRELDEAALVDGATILQTYLRIILPAARPILIVIGVLSFVGIFNEFVLARVLLRDKETWTLMVGLYVNFVSSNFANQWGLFAAGAVIGMLPTLIVYLILQDQIASGTTAGAVKG